MEWKMFAIEKLKNHQAKKQSLVSIPLEIAEIESKMKGIRSSLPDRPAVRGGSTYDDKMLNCLVRKEELQGLLDRAQLAVQEVTGALQILDPEEQLVLDRLYISPAKGKMGGLCSELKLDKTSAYRRRDAALRKFTIALYGCVES